MSTFRLYLQLDVVTQIYGNEGVTITDINYGTEVRTTERFFAAQRAQIRKIFWSRRLTMCSNTISTYYVFTTYDSARDETKAAG